MIPREKPKLLPVVNTEKIQATTTALSPDSIEVSTSSESSAAPAVTTTAPSSLPSESSAALAATTTAPPTLPSASSTAAVAITTAPSPLPPGSALQALIGKRMKPLPPANLEKTTTRTDKNPIIEVKKKDSPVSNTDPDEDTSEIKTPPMTPRSPLAPAPTVLELKVPPTPSKPLSSN